jgi:hypothetical protein
MGIGWRGHSDHIDQGQKRLQIATGNRSKRIGQGLGADGIRVKYGRERDAGLAGIFARMMAAEHPCPGNACFEWLGHDCSYALARFVWRQ